MRLQGHTPPRETADQIRTKLALASGLTAEAVKGFAARGEKIPTDRYEALVQAAGGGRQFAAMIPVLAQD